MEWAISSEFTGACIFHFSEAKMWFLYNVSEAISGHGTAFCCFVLKADKNLMFGLFSAWNNPCSSIILSDCQPHSLILLQYARWFLSANSVRQQLVGWPGAVMKTFTLRSHPPLEDSWQKDPNHQQFLFWNFFLCSFRGSLGILGYLQKVPAQSHWETHAALSIIDMWLAPLPLIKLHSRNRFALAPLFSVSAFTAFTAFAWRSKDWQFHCPRSRVCHF